LLTLPIFAIEERKAIFAQRLPAAMMFHFVRR
jgi:hypothetical protein